MILYPLPFIFSAMCTDFKMVNIFAHSPLSVDFLFNKLLTNANTWRYSNKRVEKIIEIIPKISWTMSLAHWLQAIVQLEMLMCVNDLFHEFFIFRKICLCYWYWKFISSRLRSSILRWFFYIFCSQEASWKDIENC